MPTIPWIVIVLAILGLIALPLWVIKVCRVVLQRRARARDKHAQSSQGHVDADTSRVSPPERTPMKRLDPYEYTPEYRGRLEDAVAATAGPRSTSVAVTQPQQSERLLQQLLEQLVERLGQQDRTGSKQLDEWWAMRSTDLERRITSWEHERELIAAEVRVAESNKEQRLAAMEDQRDDLLQRDKARDEALVSLNQRLERFVEDDDRSRIEMRAEVNGLCQQTRELEARVKDLEASVAQAEDDERSDPLSLLPPENADRGRVRGLMQAIALTERNERFDQAFKILSIEMGYAFCRAMEQFHASERRIALGKFGEWLSEQQIRYRYVLPEGGEGFDPKFHEAPTESNPERCAGRTLRRVLCWGIQHNSKAESSLVTRARVELE